MKHLTLSAKMSLKYLYIYIYENIRSRLTLMNQKNKFSLVDKEFKPNSEVLLS